MTSRSCRPSRTISEPRGLLCPIAQSLDEVEACWASLAPFSPSRILRLWVREDLKRLLRRTDFILVRPRTGRPLLASPWILQVPLFLFIYEGHGWVWRIGDPDKWEAAFGLSDHPVGWEWRKGAEWSGRDLEKSHVPSRLNLFGVTIQSSNVLALVAQFWVLEDGSELLPGDRCVRGGVCVCVCRCARGYLGFP